MDNLNAEVKSDSGYACGKKRRMGKGTRLREALVCQPRMSNSICTIVAETPKGIIVSAFLIEKDAFHRLHRPSSKYDVVALNS